MPIKLISLKFYSLIALMFAAGIITANPSIAIAQTLGASGLPLPRFVSLKSRRVNMRVGPGRDYQVQWLYVRKGLPMEVIQEFGNWRKVRDPRGNAGWILHSLVSGKRTVIITPWDMVTKGSSVKTPTIALHVSSSQNARIAAHIEAGSLASVLECKKDWCELRLSAPGNTDISGYVRQSHLWGVYPDEVVSN